VIKVISKELGRVYNLINLHGPYADRKSFYDGVSDSSLLKGENVTVGGDLNLTLNQRDVARSDPLVDYFFHIF
jgi:hypothetical protein